MTLLALRIPALLTVAAGLAACDMPPAPDDGSPALDSRVQALTGDEVAVLTKKLLLESELSWHGARLPEAPASAIAMTDAHQAEYLAMMSAATQKANAAWVDEAMQAGRPDQEPITFGDRLRAALALAHVTLPWATGDLDALAGSGARQALRLAGLDAWIEDFTPASHAFTPQRARWLKEQVVAGCLPGVICLAPSRTYKYPEPYQFQELRRRAGRLYCAAREAYLRQPSGTTVMGQQVMGSIEVLGSQIELLRFEPTFTLERPASFLDSTVDGPQAFALPMTVGVRMRPIGVLPSLPELRVPVTMVSADAEQILGTRPAPVSVVKPGLPGSAPSLQSDKANKVWHSVTHANAFVTGGRRLGASASIPLVNVGPVRVDLSVRLGGEIGLSSVPAGRLLRNVAGMQARKGEWTGSQLGGWPYSRHNDDAWAMNRLLMHDAPVTVNVASMGTLPAMQIDKHSPFLVRANQNDDKAMEVVTAVTVGARFQGEGGLILPPLCEGLGCALKIGIAASAGIEGTARQTHLIRERLEVIDRAYDGVEFPPRMEAAFTVTPSSSADLSVSGELRFLFWLNLGLFQLDLGFDILKGTTPIAHWEPTEWKEPHRMRLGTGSPVGNVMKQPDARSHWPGADKPEFPSFPASLDSCLRQPAPPALARPACPSAPAAAGSRIGPPRAELCAFYPSYAIGEFGPAGTSGQHACVDELLVFLGGGRHRAPQLFRHGYAGGEASHLVSARVLATTADYNGYHAIASRCASAFGSAQTLRDLILFVGPCTATARLIQPDGIIRFAGSQGQAALVTSDEGLPGQCQ